MVREPSRLTSETSKALPIKQQLLAQYPRTQRQYKVTTHQQLITMLLSQSVECNLNPVFAIFFNCLKLHREQQLVSVFKVKVSLLFTR